MQAITYTLKPGQPNSEAYYRDVRDFTKTVIKQARFTITPVIDDYTRYLRTYNLEELRHPEEYILEILSFGILWRQYAAKALKVKHAPFVTMARMSEWRKEHQKVKPLIDFGRGILLTAFLFPETSDQRPDVPTLEQVDHVCKWFEATGEFREQALRFIRWRAYWGTKINTELYNIFMLIEEFTDWFKEASEKALGKYTGNVDAFLESSEKKYRWREDRVSCTRSRLEYHLNMVGAELLNDAFREDFSKGETKAVLIPGCMRGRPAEKCEAVKVKEGLICSDCLPGCRVNKLRKEGKRRTGSEAFDVYIIPHASDLSLWSSKPGEPVRSVVASACVTTLVEGGWELKRYNVPAQCVLLDYCGCSKHWSEKGITTSFNMDELTRRVKATA